jgi:hypothetical protein
MNKLIFARIGAVCYVLWGLVHYDAVYNVYHNALGVPPTMVQGRLFQDAFYLFVFATIGIVLAITMNLHWPGVLGPALWGVGMIFTGLGQSRPTALGSESTGTRNLVLPIGLLGM